MLVEDYASSDGRKICATRFLGIKPSQDNSSKEATLQTGKRLSMKFLISIIVVHSESGQVGVFLDLLTF